MPNAIDRLFFVLGRLDGLTGTVRYDMPEALRAELRETAQKLREALDELTREPAAP